MTPVFDYTRLLTNDMAKSIQFYTEVIGLSLKMGGAEETYSEIDTGAHMLALFSRPAMLDALGENGTSSATVGSIGVVLCMSVDDVDQVYAEIESRGGKVITPPTDREAWGIRTAHFYDPDGNVVEINKNL